MFSCAPVLDSKTVGGICGKGVTQSRREIDNLRSTIGSCSAAKKASSLLTRFAKYRRGNTPIIGWPIFNQPDIARKVPGA
jgi:hypothetical protein